MASANEVARKIVGDYIVSLYGVPSLSIYDRAKGTELVQAIEKALKDEREECAKVVGRERRDYELASIQSAFPAAAQAQLKDQARVLGVVEAKLRATNQISAEDQAKEKAKASIETLLSIVKSRVPDPAYDGGPHAQELCSLARTLGITVEAGNTQFRVHESIRDACRRRQPLGGVDAEALEHGLVQVEEEREEERRKREHILGLLRNTKMEHGICKPRSRNACTACNSKDELDKIVAAWKGFTMELS